MIHPLRRRHRAIFVVLAIVLPLVIGLSVLARTRRQASISSASSINSSVLSPEGTSLVDREDLP